MIRLRHRYALPAVLKFRLAANAFDRIEMHWPTFYPRRPFDWARDV